MKELCHSCKVDKMTECKFEVEAKKIAQSVPPLNRQNLLKKGQSITSTESFAASRTIAAMRKKAEQRGCLYNSEVNPDYPGKKYT